jgi:hypothetical protein
MLALRRRFCQVVVANEIFDGADVVSQPLGKGQRTTDQTGNALSQRVVEPLDVVGLAGQFADRLVLRSQNHTGAHYIVSVDFLSDEEIARSSIGLGLGRNRMK